MMEHDSAGGFRTAIFLEIKSNTGCGIFKDKEYESVLAHLVPLAKQVITVERLTAFRALPPADMLMESVCYSEHVEAAEEVFARAWRPRTQLCVTG